MPQGEDQADDVVEFGEDHGAGIVHIVSVDDAEDVPAAVGEAYGGGVFRADGRLRPTGLAWCGGLALALHGVPLEVWFLLQRILAKAKHLKNIAKVIEVVKTPRKALLLMGSSRLNFL